MKSFLILFFILAFHNMNSQEKNLFKKAFPTTATKIDEKQEEIFKKMAEDLSVQIYSEKSNLKLYEQRAKLYLVLKEYDKAILDYDHLIENDSTNATFYYFRGLIN